MENLSEFGENPERATPSQGAAAPGVETKREALRQRRWSDSPTSAGMRRGRRKRPARSREAGVTASVNVDSGNASPLMAEGQLATAITTHEADVTVQFKEYGNSSDPVSLAGLFTGVGKAGDFSVDMRAVNSVAA